MSTGCSHQFFEVRDISYSPIKQMAINGKEQMVQGPYREGKLVMCALCGQQRQLWANGERLMLIDGIWGKLEKEQEPTRHDAHTGDTRAMSHYDTFVQILANIEPKDTSLMPRSIYQDIVDFAIKHQGADWFVTSIDAFRFKDTGSAHWIVFMQRDPSVYFPGEDSHACLCIAYNEQGLYARLVEKQRLYFKNAKGTRKHYLKRVGGKP